MGKYTFVADFNGSAEILFNRALTEGKKYNANVQGNYKAGNFQVKFLGSDFRGSYNVSENIVEIIINEKPFYISNKTIESAVKKYIGSS